MKCWLDAEAPRVDRIMHAPSAVTTWSQIDKTESQPSITNFTERAPSP